MTTLKSLQDKLEVHLGSKLSLSELQAFHILAKQLDVSSLADKRNTVSFGSSANKSSDLSLGLLSKAVKVGGAEIEAAKSANHDASGWYFQWTYNFNANEVVSAPASMKVSV